MTQIGIFSLALLLYLNFIVGFAKVSDSNDRKPETSLIYYHYHWLFADRSYHYLNSANLTNQSVIETNLAEAAPSFQGFEGDSLKFDSYAYISKIQSLKLYDVNKLVAWHLYDDPSDIKLAAGPQVNQQSCELHLDYMLYKVNKHNKHITNSTDWSIFNMINSFGSPTFGLASGNTMFLGDYKACTSYKLSITKDELVEVNKTQAEQFFRDYPKHTSNNQIRKVLKFVKKYIVPFVGITETVYDSYDAIQEYEDKIRLQPTVYCVAGIRWPSWPNSTYHKRNVVFRVGVCLPDTCDSTSLDLYSDKIKSLMNIQIPDYYSGYYINNLYCLPDERSPLRNPMRYKSTVLFIAFNAVWIVLIASATIAVYLRSKKTDKLKFESDDRKLEGDSEESMWFEYLKCWCLISNYKTFMRGGNEKKFEIKNEDPEIEEKETTVKNIVDLSSLDGLKVFGLFAVISVHTSFIFGTAGWNMVDYMHSMSTSLIPALIPLFGISVNVFFVITGTLTSIRLLQMPEATLMKPMFWLQFFIYRYLRIVPLYLFVNWMITSYARFTGSGPLWDYATSELGKKFNSDSLWEVVLLKANFKSPIDHCNGIGWYLASDLQFSLITPLFIILFLKKAHIGHLMVLITSLASVANAINQTAKYLPKTDGFLDFTLIQNMLVYDGAPIYVRPIHRFFAYTIGLSVGQLILQYGKGRIKKWPSWFTSFGKVYICLLLYVVIFAGSLKLILLNSNQPLLKFLGDLYASFYHWFTSSAAAIFIMLICTGAFPAANSLLSRKFFKVISASILSPVLIHMLLLIKMRISSQSLPHTSFDDLIFINLRGIFLSLLYGSILHITYELPMKRFLTKSLVRILGGGKKSAHRQVKN